MDLRADAPSFVPAPRELSDEDCASSGSEEVHGDLLIRQLADALVTVEQPASCAVGALEAPLICGASSGYAMPAAGLFCPSCIAGSACPFHKAGSPQLGDAGARAAKTPKAPRRQPLASAPARDTSRAWPNSAHARLAAASAPC
mmetsp:Transcript_77335/g.202955  ORF Transcript_77335/g.202955 Transcript_77335/m.202955 type:complete len:144 (-) Transcript_77335:7-438(-)